MGASASVLLMNIQVDFLRIDWFGLLAKLGESKFKERIEMPQGTFIEHLKITHFIVINILHLLRCLGKP